jgi:ADP-heptose:LPS heptosyltransferase
MNNPRIWLGRGTMLGDILSTIPVAVYLKKCYPNSYIIWAMGKKSASGAMLYLNHEAINEIFITDGPEDLQSDRDFKKYKSCDIHFSLNPQHPPGSIYPKSGDIYRESFLMQGLSNEKYDSMSDEDKIPKLVKWWNPVKRPFGAQKTVFFTGRPNFGKESKRCVSTEYNLKLVQKLMSLGYAVIQSGGENDPAWFENWKENPNDDYRYLRVNERSFFDQIQIANECDCIVGSDSGASLILGAYGLRQVSLIPIHWGNENNPTALSTNNPNNFSFYSHNGTDDIDMDLVVDKVIEKVEGKV